MGEGSREGREGAKLRMLLRHGAPMSLDMEQQRNGAIACSRLGPPHLSKSFASHMRQGL
jgi:hypothetical protein